MTQRKIEFIDVAPFTVFVMFCHLFIAFIGIIEGLVLMVFVPITQAHLITAVSIICTWLSMFGIVELMKYVMGYIHKRYNTVEKERCWYQMIIGFAGIAICGIIPKIGFLYVDNPNILYYCFITCFVTPAIFYFNFIHVFQEKWRVTYKKKHIPIILILLAIQIVVLIIIIKITTERFDNLVHSNSPRDVPHLHKIRHVMFHIFTSLLLVPITIDFSVVLSGGIKKSQNVSTLGKPIVEVNSPRPQQKDDYVSVTDFFVDLYLAFVVLFIIIGLQYLRSVPITQVNVIPALSTMCTCLLMFGILKLMKCGMAFVHKIFNTEEMKQCRNQMIIGFGGISICGITQKIVFYYVYNSDIIYYSIITSFITCVIFYYHFIFEFRGKWRVNYKEKHISFTVLLWFSGLMVCIVTLNIASIYPVRWAELCASSLVKFGFGLFYILMIFGPTMIDLVVVLVRGIKKMKKNVKLESVKTVKPSKPGNPIVEVKSPKEPTNQLPKNLAINNMIDVKMQLGGI